MPTRFFGGRPTTREERQLALRIAAVFAIPMALIMVTPLVIGALVYRHEVQARLNEDRALVARFNQERVERARAINEFVFQQCINSEVRDVVMVQQYQADIKLALREFEPSVPLNEWIQVRKDAIANLEPPGEQDCIPPPAVKPGATP